MLHVVVHSEGQEQAFDLAGGFLDVGRGPADGAVPRCFVTDPYVSRNHLRIEPTPDGSVLLYNHSQGNPARTSAGLVIAPGTAVVVSPPVLIWIGNTQVSLEPGPGEASTATTGLAVPPTGAATYSTRTEAGPGTRAEPAGSPGFQDIQRTVLSGEAPVALGALGEAPDAETLAHWFETVVRVQQAAASSRQFMDATAQAVVDLVGLDRGMVLLREGDGWHTVAAWPMTDLQVSYTILEEVLRRRRTVFRNLGPEASSESLVGVDTVVAAPVLDKDEQVMGVVFGARSLRFDGPPPRITRLEALVVQVLASAVSAGLERQEQEERILRSQVQFEQFFSPQLAQELATDASLLDGREREVTILFTDVRNFSRISERLGARRTFTMMQEVMELQSVHIRRTEGVVVDYVGDGLLAMWNAPADQADHPARACETVRGFLRELPALSERWEAEAGQPLRLGAGIHTGPALVGNTGSHVKFKYGPMGASVNLASRIENATKYLGVSPLISRATRDQLPASAGTRRLGALRLEGVASPVEIFELYPGELTAEWCERRDAFERALAAFERGAWAEACSTLAGLLTPGADYDLPSLQLFSRAVECLRSRPEPFDPAITIQKQA